MALTSQDLVFGYRFNQINFAVPGPVFPNNENIGGNNFIIKSSENQVMNINWGDGNFEEINIVAGGQWFANNSYHTFATTKALYNISFTFEKPESVVLFQTTNVNIGQVFPETITKLVNMQSIILRNTTGNFGVTTFPQDLSSLTKLKTLQVERGELTKIDDSILALPLLELLSFSGSLDLNDSAGNFEATNFDRLNELQNSLKILSLANCNINSFPETFVELMLLEFLDIGGSNTFTTLSPNLPTNINNLSLELKPVKLTSWVNFDRLINLEILNFRANTGVDEDIPIGVEISECKKLKNIIQKAITNTVRDKFILNWYNFVTANANLNPSDASIDQNKFRDMTFLASISVSALGGTYQSPTGFVLGSDNGNPTTPEERIYVLVENYGHTWNVGGTIYEPI